MKKEKHTYFLLFTKKDCPHCLEALETLMRGKRSYVLYESEDRERLDELKEEHDWPTFPIVYISNGQKKHLIGGCAELKQFLSKDMIQSGLDIDEQS